MSLGHFHETHNRVATFYKNPCTELNENSTDDNIRKWLKGCNRVG